MNPARSPSQIFPDRLREARQLRGVNQAELAQRCGLPPSAISHFEAGDRKPSFDNLRRVADALEVSVDFLVGRTEDPSGGAGRAEALFRDFQRLDTKDQDVVKTLMDRLLVSPTSKGKGG